MDRNMSGTNIFMGRLLFCFFIPFSLISTIWRMRVHGIEATSECRMQVGSGDLSTLVSQRTVVFPNLDKNHWYNLLPNKVHFICTSIASQFSHPMQAPLTPAFLYVSLDLSGTLWENLHLFARNFELEEKPQELPLPQRWSPVMTDILKMSLPTQAVVSLLCITEKTKALEEGEI